MTKIDDKVSKVGISPDGDVLEAMHAVVHAFRSKLLRGETDQPRDLSPMEGKALGYFARHPGATQSDLAAHSGRDKAQLARLIRGLRDKGLLEARLDEEDRRSTRLQVTAEGMAVFGHLHAQGAQLSGVAMADLKHGEREQLISLLRRVHERLQSAPDE